jgi:hypothetical protein
MGRPTPSWVLGRVAFRKSQEMCREEIEQEGFRQKIKHIRLKNNNNNSCHLCNFTYNSSKFRLSLRCHHIIIPSLLRHGNIDNVVIREDKYWCGSGSMRMILAVPRVIMPYTSRREILEHLAHLIKCQIGFDIEEKHRN